MALQATPAELAKVILSGLPFAIKFYASWCVPCKAYGIIYDAVAAENPDYPMYEFQIDASPDNTEYAKSIGIRGVPHTLYRKKSGGDPAAFVGAVTKEQLKGKINA